MYVTVKIRTSTKRWSGIAFSYNLVPRAGPFPSTSIPIEKLKVETRVKVLFCCSEFVLNIVDVISTLANFQLFFSHLV